MLRKHRFDSQVSKMHFNRKASKAAWNEVIVVQTGNFTMDICINKADDGIDLHL